MILTEEQYKEYDLIVGSACSMIQSLTEKKNRITISYRESTVNNFFLKIAIMTASLQQKKLYIKTNIFTYIKLKKKFGKDIHFSFSSDIDTDEIALTFCNVLNVQGSKIEDVYNAYYNS
jgi:hypothetical protein